MHAKEPRRTYIKTGANRNACAHTHIYTHTHTHHTRAHSHARTHCSFVRTHTPYVRTRGRTRHSLRRCPANTPHRMVKIYTHFTHCCSVSPTHHHDETGRLYMGCPSGVEAECTNPPCLDHIAVVKKRALALAARNNASSSSRNKSSSSSKNKQ